jgi:hypothetical protein
MTFLNPWMLLGGLAVGVPVALHFFYRARYRPLPWGAMKFLRLSVEQTSRRLRFQELLLLLLRALLCLLLALALARPASKSLTAGGGRGESVDAVLIIDTSYSMGTKLFEPYTRLDQAKAAAVKVIDNLPPNSTVRVVACADKAAVLGPRTPTNLDQARHLVRNLKASSRSTDFEAGFAAAVAAFENANGANKEVYLFSDMQRSGWERSASAVRSKCEEIKNQANLYLIRCAEKKVKNVAVVGITPQTDVPHVGARIAFSVALRNTGAEAVANLQLTFEVDGQVLAKDKDAKGVEKDSRSVEKIGPGETRAVTITGKIEHAGWHVLTARIKEDDLDEDNEFSRVIQVREKVRVLVVDGAPNDPDPSKSGSFYLGHALLPVPDELKGSYHVLPKIVRPGEASAGLLADRDVCVLANVAVGQLPANFTNALPGFVRGGKGLLITAGNNVVPKDYNAFLADLLPLPLVDAPPYAAPKDAPLTPDVNSAETNSFLAKFKETGRNPLQMMGLADTLTVLPVADPRTAEDTKDLGRVLLRFNDGRPMLASKGVGAGEVLLLTTAVDTSWGYLPSNIAFVPFVNGCLAHLVQRSASPFNFVAGQPLVWAPPDAGKPYYLVKPDGERVRLDKPKEIDGRLTLTAFDTSRAGVYRVVAEGDDEKERVKAGARFAFVPDLRESENLEGLDDGPIDDLLGFTPVHLGTGFDGSAFTGTERSRHEWTITALIALLIFAFGELLLAWFCGRAW